MLEQFLKWFFIGEEIPNCRVILQYSQWFVCSGTCKIFGAIKVKKIEKPNNYLFSFNYLLQLSRIQDEEKYGEVEGTREDKVEIYDKCGDRKEYR